MTYTAGPEAISSITALVVQARPEWDAGLVTVVLHSHAQHVDGSDLAVAAIRAARNPDLPGPKAIGWRGPHWRDLATKPVELRDPTRCTVCGKPEPQCYSHRPGIDDDHTFEPVTT